MIAGAFILARCSIPIAPSLHKRPALPFELARFQFAHDGIEGRAGRRQPMQRRLLTRGNGVEPQTETVWRKAKN